jgi:predicted Rossmann-fold nucleotide-binding protein
VVGISPGLSLDEHREKFNSPIESHDVLIFTGSGLMGREVVNIRSSDMVAILGGRSGTLGELAIAYDEDARRLVERMVKTYRLQHYKKPSIFESRRQNT